MNSTASNFGEQAMLAFLLGAGLNARPPDLEPCETDKAFVLRYALKIDRNPIDLDNRYEHVSEVYDEASFERHTVLQFAAQTSKSASIFTWLLRRMILEYGSLAAYFLPDYTIARNFSEQRFTPFLRSNATIARHVGEGSGDSDGRDSVLTKSVGASFLSFLSTKGKSSTEGMPFRVVAMDEVRRMEFGDIERVLLRMAAQANPWLRMASTASHGESTIDKYFMETDQRFFHTACATDPEGLVLSTSWPDCIADLTKMTPAFRRKVEHAFSHAGVPFCGMTDEDRKKYRDACYIHPKTGEIITNPRNGWWEPHGPATFRRGYQLSSMHAWNHPAGRILDLFERARDIAEFHNSVLGMTYTNEAGRLVKPEHLEGSQDPALLWPANQTYAWRRKNVRATAMGVDVQHGYLIAVIKEKSPNGKHRTIHVEVVYDHDGDDTKPIPESNGWRRLGALMHEFDVRLCVIDQAPLFDSTLHFAKAFKGRVYLASYADDGEVQDIARWQDDVEPNTRKGKEQKFRHSVRINRTKGLQWALGRWSHWDNETPPAGQLVQKLPVVGDKVRLSASLNQGHWEPRAIVRDLYWKHQMCVIFKDAYEGDTDAERVGKRKMIAEHIGEDPHFAHANLYCDVALDRLRR